jgi:hypothetical protein
MFIRLNIILQTHSCFSMRILLLKNSDAAYICYNYNVFLFICTNFTAFKTDLCMTNLVESITEKYIHSDFIIVIFSVLLKSDKKIKNII